MGKEKPLDAMRYETKRNETKNVSCTITLRAEQKERKRERGEEIAIEKATPHTQDLITINRKKYTSVSKKF